MATWVSFLDLKTGVAFDVNVADPNVADLRVVPDSVLSPLGIASGAGTYIEYDTGHKTAVRGTLAATATAFAGGGVAPSKAIYVDTAGSDATGQRGSAVFPFLTMAAALAVAQSGDEVLVSPGTYSGAFTIPAIANLTIRGSGWSTGQTVLTAGAAVDVCTLGAANRSIIFDNIQIAGATTGRAVVGTGAASAGAWLSTGVGLLFQDCLLSSAAGSAIVLTDAGLVYYRDSLITAAQSYTTCSSVQYVNSQGAGGLTWTFDNTDANKPTAGQSSGLEILAGSKISGTTTLGGQAKINVNSGATIGTLTALNLSVAAGPVSPSINVSGTVGAVDFNTTTAALPSAALGAYTVSFAGATQSAAAMNFRVATGATRQAINLVGLTAAQACTFTGDALCDLNMRGAALTTPTYATANTGVLGAGTLIPPYLSLTGLNIAAGGAIAFTFAATAGLTTAGSATFVANVSQTVIGGASLAVTAKSTTGFSITSTAAALNTADVYITWP